MVICGVDIITSKHDRISKKWIKRFGYVKRPTAYRTPYGIICHPELVDEIREDDIVQV